MTQLHPLQTFTIHLGFASSAKFSAPLLNPSVIIPPFTLYQLPVCIVISPSTAFAVHQAPYYQDTYS